MYIYVIQKDIPHIIIQDNFQAIVNFIQWQSISAKDICEFN